MAGVQDKFTSGIDFADRRKVDGIVAEIGHENVSVPSGIKSFELNDVV